MNSQRFPWWGWGLMLLALLGAGAGPGFLLQPVPRQGEQKARPFFDYQVPAGTLIHDALLVSNLSQEPLTLRLYAADAHTALNGGLAFPSAEEPPQAAGRWITLTRTRMTLSPGETQQVAFRVRVPEQAQGEYVAGLIAQPEGGQAVEPEGNLTVVLLPRVAVVVRVRVISPQAPLAFLLHLDDVALTHASDGAQTLRVHLSNPGRYGVQGKGELTLRDTAGRLVRTFPCEVGYVLPGDTVTLAFPVTPPLPPGDYRVDLALRHPDGLNFTARREITLAAPVEPESARVMPEVGRIFGDRWLVVAVLVLAALVLLETWGLYRLHRRLRRKHP